MFRTYGLTVSIARDQETMDSLVAALPGLIALVMVCLAMLPNRVANRVPSLFGHTVALLSFIAMLASLAAGWVITGRDTPLTAVFSPRLTSPIGMGVYLDPVAVVMAVLISFIGLIIARFSIRYLSGDANQGRFFRWMSLTLGASLFMAIASNLLVFGIAWMLTSLGLHQLLTHYPERPWAIWASRKKFLISRVGDILLLGAIWLTFTHLGTLDYAEIFAWAEKSRVSVAETDPVLPWITLLFVLGAMTKSAQVPFHTWLPDTMETPTPVSALMHAGVINAGGFLVIRLSPLLTLTPLALDLLALAGAVTALLGGVVMLTQTSIKRSLAYSTIAQMGFMMLQCGLGAFSAAMLHIVAHSAYKAHAFLRSGSVLEKAPSSLEPWTIGQTAGRGLGNWLIPPAISLLLVSVGFYLLGIHPLTKPGGLLLGMVLALALTQFLVNSWAISHRTLVFHGFAGASLLCAAYFTAFAAMDHLVAPSVAAPRAAPSVLEWCLMALVAVGFALVFLLQRLAGRLAQTNWMRGLHVHAMNGFYIDIPARRLTARFYGQSSPVP